MSAESALKHLAQQVRLICAEHKRLKRRYAQLEKRVEKLSQAAKKGGGQPARAAAAAGGGAPELDKERIKTKVEEMLAELADIG